jgi:hypothetical protein
MTNPMNRRAALGALAGTDAMLGATASAAAIEALSRDVRGQRPRHFRAIGGDGIRAVERRRRSGFTLPTRDEWFEGAAEAYQTLTMLRRRKEQTPSIGAA